MARNKIVESETAKPIAEASTLKTISLKPISAKTTLGGPRSILNRHACSLKLPSEILEASGLWPNDQVELSAGDGVIVITKTGGPLPVLPDHTPKNIILDNLMRLTRDFEKREREARGCNLIDMDSSIDEVP